MQSKRCRFQMMVMPANNAKMHVGYMAGRWPGRIGWLLSPGGWKTPHDWLPYAIDNGAFSVWTKGGKWNESAFYAHCEKTRRLKHKPIWIAVPDVVADCNATLNSWRRHFPKLSQFGKLAFVVQNGMKPDDVPENADVIFVGGTTEWKWKTLTIWTGNFPRVHVGRVNSERLLWRAHNAGAESCDGTGWFRGNKDQLAGLFRYLNDSSRGMSRIDEANGQGVLFGMELQ